MSLVTHRPPANPARRRRPRAFAPGVFLRGVLVFVLVLGVGVSALRAADSSTAIANGRQLYLAVGCWQCHGTVGQGGSAGPRLAPGPMPLEALRAFLRNSVRAMPAYPETILTDAAVADIHAYLQSIPAAPPAETLPLLRELR